MPEDMSRQYEHRTSGSPFDGREPATLSSPLKTLPTWLAGFAWLMVSLAVGALIALSTCHVPEVATGRGVIDDPTVADLFATRSGRISQVLAVPGDAVLSGEVLAAFHSGEIDEQLKALLVERSGALASLLHDPESLDARKELGRVDARLDELNSGMAASLVRSPRPGVVGSLYVTSGAVVQDGDLLLTLVGSNESLSVHMAFPGEYLRQIRPGARASFTLDGLPSRPIEVEVESVSPHLLTSDELTRSLRPSLRGVLRTVEPVVVGRGKLRLSPRADADFAGQLAHGMSGTASVTVGRHSLSRYMFPWLSR